MSRRRRDQGRGASSVRHPQTMNSECRMGIGCENPSNRDLRRSLYANSHFLVSHVVLLAVTVF